MDPWEHKDEGHERAVMKGLNALRDKKLLFDITLIAEGKEFKAHKAVLASCSEYFRAMFTDEMKECKLDVITLNGVSAPGLAAIVDFAYTAKLKLDVGNIQDVLSTASHTQVISIIESCATYLERFLDFENCIDVATISETYFLQHLKKKAYICIGKHFMNLTCSEQFLNMPTLNLVYLLECNYPIRCSEEDILNAVLNWVEYKESERMAQAGQVLRHINFQNIAVHSLSATLQLDIFQRIVQEHPFIETELFCGTLDNKSETLAKTLMNKRGFEKTIVTIGGFDPNHGLNNRLSYFHTNDKKWKKLSAVPHLQQTDFGVAVLNNELYIAGGNYHQGIQDDCAHSFLFKYNPATDKWTTLSSMLRPRCKFYLGVVGNKLYACAGLIDLTELEGVNPDISTASQMSPCEVYDPETDKWSFICEIDSKESYNNFPGVVHGHNIYISGGMWTHETPMASDYDDVEYLVTEILLKLDTRNNQWEIKESMPTERVGHMMEIFQDKIIVAGGWKYINPDLDDDREIIKTVDMYDIKIDQWITINQQTLPKYHAGAALIGSRIFIIGGFESFDKKTAMRQTNRIAVYNAKENIWEEDQWFPFEIWEHMCCTLEVPMCREDLHLPITTGTPLSMKLMYPSG
ncbi:unnamed protein product [Owenia fusiformis]|uniref:Uncharacterized protein n=1 Tax=Owenia fusiformis TaxID=6347 RepID=A0A8J1TSC1_OWEFU|nr:unnamed protein product [Owenia fusiformis]